MDPEKNLRELLKAKAEEVQSAPEMPDRVLRRSKVRRAVSASLASAVLIAASAGVLTGIRSIVDRPSFEPAHPAPTRIDRGDQTADLKGDATEKLGSCSGPKHRPGGRSRNEAMQVPLNLGPVEMLVAILGSGFVASSGCVEAKSVDLSSSSKAQGGGRARGAGNDK